jgi:hypothetical protein
MARLTRKEERLLRRTADVVRMYVACLTVAAPVMCVLAAQTKYGARARAGVPPGIDPLATWGNIAGIYLPLFAVVGAYVWATRPAPDREPAPNGFAMALFRDAFTMGVLTLVLLVPWGMYRFGSSIQGVNTYVVWYQTVLTAVAGGAFAYYFHGRIATDRPGASSPPAAARKTAPRRARQGAPAGDPAPASAERAELAEG